jgi:hypothetical protein
MAKKGEKMSEETKAKISFAKRDKRLSLEHRKSIGDSLRGRTQPKELKERWSIIQKGKKLSKEHRHNLSLSGTWFKKGMKPENHPCWIIDRSKVKRQENRNNPEYKQWRHKVYIRDGFKCRIANKDCEKNHEVHHILAWRDYPELRYEINNGITLCRAHHPRKRDDEAKSVTYFQQLVKEGAN